MAEELIICRCQEVTQEEIVQAIADGAASVDGVKGRLVQGIVARETGQNPADVLPQKNRMPARPVKIGAFGGDEDV